MTFTFTTSSLKTDYSCRSRLEWYMCVWLLVCRWHCGGTWVSRCRTVMTAARSSPPTGRSATASTGATRRTTSRTSASTRCPSTRTRSLASLHRSLFTLLTRYMALCVPVLVLRHLFAMSGLLFWFRIWLQGAYKWYHEKTNLNLERASPVTLLQSTDVIYTRYTIQCQNVVQTRTMVTTHYVFMDIYWQIYLKRDVVVLAEHLLNERETTDFFIWKPGLHWEWLVYLVIISIVWLCSFFFSPDELIWTIFQSEQNEACDFQIKPTRNL